MKEFLEENDIYAFLNKPMAETVFQIYNYIC